MLTAMKKFYDIEYEANDVDLWTLDLAFAWMERGISLAA